MAIEFFGRRAELDQLSAFLDSARLQGHARLLWGEPGVGKSALMAAAAELAVTTGMRVLRASGSEFEADVSYSCLNQLLLPVNAEIEGLPPSLREALSVALGFGVGAPTDALLVGNAALLLVKQVAAEVPLALLVEQRSVADLAHAQYGQRRRGVRPPWRNRHVSDGRAGAWAVHLSNDLTGPEPGCLRRPSGRRTGGTESCGSFCWPLRHRRLGRRSPAVLIAVVG